MPSDSGPRSIAALEMAERVGDRGALVEALRARQFACSGPEGAEERLALGDRLLALGLDGDDDATLWGHLWRFDAYAQIGEIGGGRPRRWTPSKRSPRACAARSCAGTPCARGPRSTRRRAGSPRRWPPASG